MINAPCIPAKWKGNNQKGKRGKRNKNEPKVARAKPYEPPDSVREAGTTKRGFRTKLKTKKERRTSER
jgi:hypothetical protein